MSEVNNNNNEVNNNNNKSPCKNIYDTFKKALPFVKSLFAKSVTTGEENSTINSSDRRTPENAVGGRTVTTQQSSRFQRHTNIKNLKIKDFVIPGMSNEDMLKLAIEDSKEDERIMNGGGSSSSSSSGCSSSSPSSSSSSSPSGSIPSSENVRSSNGKNIGATGKNSTAHVTRETPWIANAYGKGSCMVDEDNKCIDMAIKEINELPQNVLDEINKLSDSIATPNGKQALFRLIGQGFRIENGDTSMMSPNLLDFQFHKLSNADKLEAIRIFNESANPSKREGNIQMAFIEFVKEHQPKNKNN